jgi:transcriptional regulator with GAF, ATPase, and Fis domain
VKEQTITETGLDVAPRSQGARPTPGVVAVFQRTARPLVAHRVLRERRIGRDESADIGMEDPALSRFHAQLVPTPNGFMVTDLGSRNGTSVDGVRLAGEAVLAAFGSTIRLGRTLLLVVADVTRFEVGGADEPPAAAAAESEATAALIGGPSLDEVRARIATFAPGTAPVLVEGETGAGKEVVASLVHRQSGRSGKLVAVNCAALSEELVESELFGHGRGAFSGAAGPRAGLFRSADRGTLLLDEVGELPPQVQAKLLRVIESGEVRAVGEDAGAPVDVRVLTATNRDLDEMVQRGAFRADLYHRIAAARIHLPPLRERLEDVPRLVAGFLDPDGMRATVGLVEACMHRRWPGNVRELKNAVLAAAAVARRDGRTDVRADDAALGEQPDTAGGGDASLRARVTRALVAADGNVTRAAQDLGVARSGFYETLRRLAIDPSSFRRG